MSYLQALLYSLTTLHCTYRRNVMQKRIRFTWRYVRKLQYHDDESRSCQAFQQGITDRENTFWPYGPPNPPATSPCRVTAPLGTVTSFCNLHSVIFLSTDRRSSPLSTVGRRPPYGSRRDPSRPRVCRMQNAVDISSPDRVYEESRS